MINKLNGIAFFFLLISCSSITEEERKTSIPEGSNQLSGFHTIINHGQGNAPVSLLKADSMYHLYYTTGTNQLGHLTSPSMFQWNPTFPVPIPKNSTAKVVWDNFNTSNLNSPFITITKSNDGVNLSHSKDGTSWQSYENNPVLSSSGSELSVFWDEDIEHWILAILNEKVIYTYSSIDLINWEENTTFSFDEISLSIEIIKQEGDYFLLIKQDKVYIQKLELSDNLVFSMIGDLVEIAGTDNLSIAGLKNGSKTTLIGKVDSDGKYPAFTMPLTFSFSNSIPRISIGDNLKKLISSKRRSRLSQLSGDGPSWFSFRIDEDFNQMRISVSNEHFFSRIEYDSQKKDVTIDRTSISTGKKDFYTVHLERDINLENVDIVVDYRAIYISFDDGIFFHTFHINTPNYLNLVEVYLDGKKYDARGVLYDIGI